MKNNAKKNKHFFEILNKIITVLLMLYYKLRCVNNL